MKRLIDYSSRFRILKGGKISLVVSALLGSVTLSFAAPSSGTVVSGSATISQNGSTTNINQSSQKASINWQNFSIASGETVNFNQPNSSSITLNRVIGNERSVIDGALNANGQVWLLNSNGVLFGKNASINTAGLLATTAKLSDVDFQAGNYNFTDATNNSVINAGKITVSDSGSVILASNEVRNSGTIQAVKGKVHLVGADSYSINLSGNSLVNLKVEKGVLDSMVENSGTIIADGGEIYLTTNAVDELLKGVVNNTGIIEANSLDGLTGKVVLTGEEINLKSGSTITATGENGGGEILIGGDWQGSGELKQAVKVTMESGATIDASATQNGDGGKVVIWSDIHNPDSTTKAYGTILAKGGNESGDGGKVETSGATIDIDGIYVDTTAQNGETGDYLIDPYDYYIRDGWRNNIVSALNTNNVTISVFVNNTSFGSTGDSGNGGQIYFQNDLTSTSGNDLTLIANGDVWIYDNVDIDITGDLIIQTGRVVPGSGTINKNISSTISAASVSIVSSGSYVWVDNITSTGDISISSTDIEVKSQLQTTGESAKITLKAKGDVVINNNAQLLSNGGDITLWSDSDSNGGYIYIQDGVTIDTRTQADRTANNGTSDDENGGAITLGGGSASATLSSGTVVPTGYALNNTDNSVQGGISLGTTTLARNDSGISFISGGGDISLKGQQSSTYSGESIGISAYEGFLIDAGKTGNITLVGDTTGSSGSYPDGINLGNYATTAGGTASYIKTVDGDITLTGTSGSGSTESRGVLLAGGGAGIFVQSIGSGNINITGTPGGGTGTQYNILFMGANILANSGDIDLVGGSTGTIYSEFFPSTIGYKSGSDVTTSSSDITVTADNFDLTSGIGFNTSGILAIKPTDGNSFTSTFDTSSLTYSTDLSGLTIGHSSNTGDIIVGSSTTIAGDIALYGGDIAVNANLTSTASSADILFKGSGNITQDASTSVTSNGGDVTYWADSDGDGSGYIHIQDGVTIDTRTQTDRTANNGTADDTNGGNIVLAGGADDGSNGGTASDGIPDGYATSSILSGVSLGSSTANVTTMYSGSGDIIVRGKTTSSSSTPQDKMGIMQWGEWIADSSNGAITIAGISDNYYGINFGQLANPAQNMLLLRSNKSSGTAISITGESSNAYGVVFTYNNPKLVEATGGGDIIISGTGAGFGPHGMFLRNQDILSSGGNVVLDGGVSGIFVADGLTIGSKSGSSITSSSANITLTGDAFNFGGSTNINTNGTLAIQPKSDSFASPLTWPATNLTLADTISSLTIGKNTNTANITIDNAISIAGPIDIHGGDITINNKLEAINGTINLDGSGNIIDGESGYVIASNLLLSDGTVTLDNLLNDIDYIAGSGLDSLTFYDTDGISIGSTIGGVTGIGATGNIILSAGADESAGTSTGGDITVTGTPIISSSGGNVKLYTGSISGSTNLASLISSGNFRYNSDESVANYTTALGATGIYAIYREQPTASVTVGDQTLTYGDSLDTITGTTSGTVNGDTPTYGVSGADYSTSNNLKAGSYTLTATGLTDLGYNVTGTHGTLTVNTKALNITGLTTSSKTYDGLLGATLTGTETLTNGGTANNDGLYLTGDTVSLTGTAAGTFDTENVGTDKTVTVSGLSLDGADKDNYTLNPYTLTADITPKTVTLSASKTYDGTTDLTGAVTLGGFIGTETLNYSGAVSNDSHVATAGKYINAITLENGTNGGLASNYILPTLNNANAPLTINAATLTPTITNIGVTKTYDGTTNAPAGFTPTFSYAGLVAGDTTATLSFSGAAYDDKDVLDATKITVSGLSIDSITGSNGSYSSDYVLDTNSKEVAATITKATLTVTANNDAKFVTQADGAFNGVSYSGFVNGETTADINIVGLDISRTNVGTDTAGTYNDVLQASGLASNNYSFNYVNGDYTIVPSDQLLVRVTNVNDTYGTATQYTLSSVEYYNGTNVVTLGGGTGSTDITNNLVTITDGSGGSATFTVAPQNPTTSTANKLAVGSYQLGVDGIVTENSANFSNTVTIVGAHQVDQQALTATATGVSKVYDGTKSVSGVTLGLNTLETNDVVTVDGLGSFSSKNVGTNLNYAISNLVLSGDDASNYYLSNALSLTGNDGIITKKDITNITNITVDNKVYDGTRTATAEFGDAIYNGIIGGRYPWCIKLHSTI